MWLRRFSTSSARLTAALPEQLWYSPTSQVLADLILTTPAVEFTPSSVAIGFHRLGKFRDAQVNPKVVSKLYKLAENKQFSPQDLANICYGVGLGRLDVAVPWFAQKQLEERGIDEFNAKDVTHLLIGLSRLKVDNLHWFNRAEELFFRPTSRRLGRFLEKDLASCAWSFARMRYPSQSVFDVLAREVKQRNPKAFNAQDTSQLFYSLANCGAKPSMFDYEEVYEMLSKEIYNNRELKEWCNEEQLSLIAAGAARKQFSNKHLLFRYLAQHIVRFRNLAKKEFSTHALERLLDSYGAIESRIHTAATEELQTKIKDELDRRSKDALANARKRQQPVLLSENSPMGKYALGREKRRRNITMLE